MRSSLEQVSERKPSGMIRSYLLSPILGWGAGGCPSLINSAQLSRVERLEKISFK